MWIDANPTTSNQGLNLVIVFFEKVFPLYLKQKEKKYTEDDPDVVSTAWH